MIPTPAASLASAPLSPVRKPEARALDLETLFFARRIVSLEWSADGREIFFETNITGRFNIWRVPRDGGWPVQLTVAEERTALQQPSPDGRWLLYSQDRGGNEKPNLFLLPPGGGPARNVTHTEGVGYRSVQWSPDGTNLAMAAERSAPGAYEVYLLDPDTTAVRKVADHRIGECARLRWSPDGRALALTRTRDFLHTGISVLDLTTGEERVLIPIDETTASLPLGWTRDGTGLLVNSNATDDGVSALALLDVATARLRWLTSGPWDADTSAVSPAEDVCVYARNEAGSHRVFVRRLRGEDSEVPLGPGILATARFSSDGQTVALLHSSAETAQEIYTYEMRGGAIRQISQSLVGGLTEEDFVRPQLVTYPSFDGTPIAAFVYLPPNLERGSSHPAIVYPHGGPTSQYTNGWNPRVQYLVSHGFVVIAPNFRGSTGFGRAFQEANKRDLGGGDLRDVVAAAEFLARSGYVDPRRIAIMGGSYGGYLTLMALTRYPHLWAAGVALVPFANWFTEYAHEDPTLQAYDRAMMGDPVTDEALWRDRSPIFFADRIRAPLLVLAGENDIRCPPGEARQIIEAVRRAGGTADLRIYEQEGHGLARRENEIDAIRRTAEFLRAHVAGP
jgi:dipeptidyl aminopeptidase/acylaminoacyl peptidase